MHHHVLNDFLDGDSLFIIFKMALSNVNNAVVLVTRNHEVAIFDMTDVFDLFWVVVAEAHVEYFAVGYQFEISCPDF